MNFLNGNNVSRLHPNLYVIQISGLSCNSEAIRERKPYMGNYLKAQHRIVTDVIEKLLILI